MPYFLNKYYVDLLGKNDKYIAHGPTHQHQNFKSLLQEYTSFYPGHMKWEYPYVLSQYRPDVFAEFYEYFGEDNNKQYLAKDYERWVSPSDKYEFYILKGSKNVILKDLKRLP